MSSRIGRIGRRANDFHGGAVAQIIRSPVEEGEQAIAGADDVVEVQPQPEQPGTPAMPVQMPAFDLADRIETADDGHAARVPVGERGREGPPLPLGLQH